MTDDTTDEAKERLIPPAITQRLDTGAGVGAVYWEFETERDRVHIHVVGREPGEIGDGGYISEDAVERLFDLKPRKARFTTENGVPKARGTFHIDRMRAPLAWEG